jgi:hypothetical protein
MQMWASGTINWFCTQGSFSAVAATDEAVTAAGASSISLMLLMALVMPVLLILLLLAVTLLRVLKWRMNKSVFTRQTHANAGGSGADVDAWQASADRMPLAPDAPRERNPDDDLPPLGPSARGPSA